MLKLSIVTPEKRIMIDAEVEDLVVPAEGGEIEILPDHTALMTTLLPGVLRYTLKNNGEKGRVSVSWGYCEVFNNGINILAETAERPEEIDIPREEADLKKWEEKLSAPNLEPLEIEDLQAKKERALVRIAIAKATH